MDMIVCTPTEYLPALLIVGLVVTSFFVLLRAIVAKQNHDKKLLREGRADEVEEYGLDYMASHVGTIVLGVVAAFLLPGMVYEALGATCDYAGAILIGLLAALIVGLGEAKTLGEVVELFRNKAKIKALKDETKNQNQ